MKPLPTPNTCPNAVFVEVVILNISGRLNVGIQTNEFSSNKSAGATLS